MEPILVVTFAFGLTLGSLISFLSMRQREQEAIERALDTIGIRRKEFLKLKSEVEALSRLVEERK